MKTSCIMNPFEVPTVKTLGFCLVSNLRIAGIAPFPIKIMGNTALPYPYLAITGDAFYVLQTIQADRLAGCRTKSVKFSKSMINQMLTLFCLLCLTNFLYYYSCNNAFS